MGDDRDAAIKVAVRCRVFLPFEIKQGNTESVVNVLPNDSIKIQPPQLTSLDESRYQFTFDATYGSKSTQADVFNRSIRPLVDSCLEGYNATCIAYGQTGSGKTHTILGQTDQSDHTVPPEKDNSEAGVIPRALRALFRSLTESKESSTEQKRFESSVKVQFLELYGEDIRDLLQTDPNKAPKLSIRDGSAEQEPEVLGIKSVDVESAEEALLCLTRGTLRRVTRATAMNAESSRSHAIMTVLVEQKMIQKVKGEDGNLVEETALKNSKFHFVDLAGSERIKRTHATGQGVKEGININKGLLILGNVISALASQGKNKNAFVPYRDSKLTRLLKGSLGGNHKTLMIACVSPSGSNTEESLNTLRYANRAKNIQNRAVINMDAGSKMIADLRAQLKAMAAELLRVRSMVAKGVTLDGEGAIFTEEILLALAGGVEVNLNMEELLSKPASKKAGESNTTASEQTVSTAPSTVATTAGKKDKKSVVPSNGNDDSAELKKAKEEIAKLRRALEKSDDRVLEAQRQLEWMKEELKISKEEVLALAAVEKSSDGDSSASNVSALTEDFENMPRLSQETYEVSR